MTAERPSLREALLNGTVCMDCAEPLAVCQAKANVKGACWRWNEARGEFGFCVTCGRPQTSEQAIQSDVCGLCDQAVAL